MFEPMKGDQMYEGALIVRVIFQDRGDGGLRVFSPDVRGLHLSGADREAVLRDVVPAIKILFEKNHDLRVEAHPVVPTLESMFDPAAESLPIIAAMETGQFAVRRAMAA